MKLSQKIVLGLAAAGGVIAAGGAGVSIIAIRQAEAALKLTDYDRPDGRLTTLERYGFWIGYQTGYFRKDYNQPACGMCGAG